MPIHYQSQQLPPDYQRHINELLARAQALATERHIPYTRERVAPLPPEFLRAADMVNRNRLYERPLEHAEDIFSRQAYNRFPDFLNTYINPYEKHVVRNLENEAERTFKEKILPALDNKFIRLGQHGGSKHREMARQAARDLQGLLAERRHHALSQGFGQAREAFNADEARHLLAAQELGNVGRMRQAGNLADIAALQDIGNARHRHEQLKRDIGFQEYLRELGLPAERLSQWSNIVQGAPHNMSSHWFENPLAAPPQMNAMGNIGSIASSILGMRGMR